MRAETKPLCDLDQILLGGRYHRHNHLFKFWWRSVKGFCGWRGSNFALFHRLSSSSLQYSCTTVWVSDGRLTGYMAWVCDWRGCLHWVHGRNGYWSVTTWQQVELTRVVVWRGCCECCLQQASMYCASIMETLTYRQGRQWTACWALIWSIT